MKSILSLILGCAIGIGGTFYYFSTNINKQSTDAIDADIAKYNAVISELDKEISKYSGGLILTMLQAQRAIYSNNIAALESKKMQFAHWINYDYQIDNNVVLPLGDMDAYEQELIAINNNIEKDEKESALYKPCLIKTLIELRIAQQRMTVAGIERAIIAKKYNLPFIITPTEVKETPKNKVIQTPEQDKESL
ncbi:hypothetical protein [uncultured Desulfovibrio sp.]|uniref:hypothetical protein n=1 Tax=uncultured Desulfovibrio sp. TaxID=167968 RepID=UPI00266C1F50|nr:hypothetical protein [uncultured Desulfovibrio sp.]